MKQQKNKQMYWTTLLIIFVIVSNLALAQSIPTNVQPLSKVFNEANPELFDYINGDYSTVTWSKIPPNFISKIPKDKLKYDELKPEQRIKMTPDQISVNFEKINDLAKDVDADNARAAIKNKFNVNVIRLDSAKIREGILHANDGYKEHITLSNKYYQSGFILIAETGEIIFTPLEEEIIVPEQDAITINADQQELKYKGYVVKEGGLSFKEGKTFIKPNGNSVIINDVLINPTKNHAIDIYIEPLTNPNGNYVAFFKEGLDIGTTKEGTIIVMPKPGNLLFNMVKREYKKDKEGKLIRDEFVLVEDDRDKLFLVVTKGDSLKVVSRAKEGKTPLIKHFYGGGETNIQTGRGMRFTFINGKLSYRPPKPVSENEIGRIDTTSSVAFELVSDTDFNTVVRTSSSNRFIQTYNGKQIAGNNRGLEVSDLIEPNMMKTINDLRIKYQKVNFNKLDGRRITLENEEVTTNLIQVLDEWLREKEGVEKYIGDTIFLGEGVGSSFEMPTGDCTDGNLNKDIVACHHTNFLVLGERGLDPSTQNIYKNSVLTRNANSLQILDHEFAHSINVYGLAKEKKLIQKFINENRNNPEFKEKVKDYSKKYFGVSPEEATTSQLILVEKLLFQEANLKNLHQKQLMSSSPDSSLSLGEYRGYPAIVQSLKDFKSSEKFAEFVTEYNGLGKRYDLKPLSPTVGVYDFFLELSNLRDSTNPELRKEIIHAIQQLDNTFLKETGLYPYSLHDPEKDMGTELFSTYGELPPETARKNIELAQVEFDRVMSTDPPKWLKKRAEDRYYAIMGGEDGIYCKTNPCGPCLRYKVTCDTESISSIT